MDSSPRGCHASPARPRHPELRATRRHYATAHPRAGDRPRRPRRALAAAAGRPRRDRTQVGGRRALAVRNIALVVRSVHQPAALVGRSRVETLFLLLVASPRARAWRRRRREVAQVRHLVCVPPACDFYSGVSLLRRAQLRHSVSRLRGGSGRIAAAAPHTQLAPLGPCGRRSSTATV